MAISRRNFEPTVVWSDKDGLLTERAKGYLRSLYDFLGVSTGTVPVTSLGGDGVSTTTFMREDGTWSVPMAIEDEGVALTQRATLNFVGVNVSVADSGSKTVVTVGGTPTTAVSTSGTTQTLQKATTALIGSDVTYILTVPGYLDITTQGGDTIQVDGSQTTIRLDNDGASVTLRCLTATTWGIV